MQTSTDLDPPKRILHLCIISAISDWFIENESEFMINPSKITNQAFTLAKGLQSITNQAFTLAKGLQSTLGVDR